MSVMESLLNFVSLIHFFVRYGHSSVDMAEKQSIILKITFYTKRRDLSKFHVLDKMHFDLRRIKYNMTSLRTAFCRRYRFYIVCLEA